MLFNGPDNKFGLSFFSQNRSIITDNLYFTPSTDDADVVANGPEVKKGKEGDIDYNEEFPGEAKTVSMFFV